MTGDAFGSAYSSLEDEIIDALPKSGEQVYTPYTCTLFDIRPEWNRSYGYRAHCCASGSIRFWPCRVAVPKFRRGHRQSDDCRSDCEQAPKNPTETRASGSPQKTTAGSQPALWPSSRSTAYRWIRTSEMPYRRCSAQTRAVPSAAATRRRTRKVRPITSLIWPWERVGKPRSPISTTPRRR